MGRPLGSQNKDKPYRDALRMEAAALANGEIMKHPVGSLRAIAQARLLAACTDDGQSDAKEIADRLDGRVPQAVVGDDEHGPIAHTVTWKTP
jgi:hypothetical protein